MKEVATALLRVGDDSLVMQRRREDHYRNPGLLGLFGGHLDPEDEGDPEAALDRELGEETSLILADLIIRRVTTFFMPERVTGDDLWYHMHDISLPSSCFEVKDGTAELIPSRLAALHTDLEPAVQFAFERIGEFNGS